MVNQGKVMTIISYKKRTANKKRKILPIGSYKWQRSTREYHNDLFLQKTTLGEDQINLFLQQTAISQKKIMPTCSYNTISHGKIIPIFFCRNNNRPRVDQVDFFLLKTAITQEKIMPMCSYKNNDEDETILLN